MAEVKEFKTESKRLLDLMINSIYTNKEIFLRELISNASDAIDKYHYLCLKDGKVDAIDHFIQIETNKENRTLTITDNGIGIPDSDISRVFEKSFTGINGRIKAKSTGMGLYIVHNLCKKMGHKIMIESCVSSYTKITIVFSLGGFYKIND